MEKRGRSPSLRQKNWNIEQQISRSSPELIYSSVVEQKKLLSSAELKKVPIYSKYTVSSLLYAQNVKRPHSFDYKTSCKQSPRRSVDRPPPPIAPSKVMPTKTKSNEDNLSSSYTKPSSPKPEDTKKPHPRNYVNVTESNVIKSSQLKQPTKGFGTKTVAAEKKLRFHNDDLLSSKDLTTYEECDKIITSNESTNDILIVDVHNNNQHLVEDLHGEMESQKDDKILEVLVPICLEGNADDDMHQTNACSDPDNVMVVESVNNEHLNDYNDETNQQDQTCEETFDVGGDHLITSPNVDKENKKAENEQLVAREEVGVGSKFVEDDEERKQNEPEVKEGGDDDVAPNKEDLISKMVVAYQQVVAHGKKDIATYNSVTEETISKLRERRSNKVKALVGAFESVISHDQYDVLPKRLLHINKNQTC